MKTRTAVSQTKNSATVRELRTGTRTSQCSDCGEYFGGVDTFDKHLISNKNPDIAPACMTSAQMEAKGLTRNVNGVWGQAWRGK